MAFGTMLRADWPCIQRAYFGGYESQQLRARFDDLDDIGTITIDADEEPETPDNPATVGPIDLTACSAEAAIASAANYGNTPIKQLT